MCLDKRIGSIRQSAAQYLSAGRLASLRMRPGHPHGVAHHRQSGWVRAGVRSNAHSTGATASLVDATRATARAAARTTKSAASLNTGHSPGPGDGHIVAGRCGQRPRNHGVHQLTVVATGTTSSPAARATTTPFSSFVVLQARVKLEEYEDL